MNHTMHGPPACERRFKCSLHFAQNANVGTQVNGFTACRADHSERCCDGSIGFTPADQGDARLMVTRQM